MRLFIILASILAAVRDFGRNIRRDFDWILFGAFALMFLGLLIALATSGAPMPDELTGVVR